MVRVSLSTQSIGDEETIIFFNGTNLNAGATAPGIASATENDTNAPGATAPGIASATGNDTNAPTDATDSYTAPKIDDEKCGSPSATDSCKILAIDDDTSVPPPATDSYKTPQVDDETCGSSSATDSCKILAIDDERLCGKRSAASRPSSCIGISGYLAVLGIESGNSASHAPGLSTQGLRFS